MARTATMRIWNVELGLAIHIKAPNGKYVVIDMGSTQNVSPLQDLVMEDVGYMVITHPHYDHISDIKNIVYAKPTVLWRVKAYTSEELLKGIREQEREAFERYCDFCESYNSDVSPENSPTSDTALGGMKVRVFSTSNCDKSNKNNFSAVVVIELGPAKIVVCGDNEKESLDELMGSPSFVDASKNAWVLVAPHHGRESGYQEDFVNNVNPHLTIISDTKKSDTSAADKYSKKSKGTKIHKPDSYYLEDRSCLTTRKDGNIEIKFGECDTNPNGILIVRRGVE